MLRIGFTTQFYTLWSVSSKEEYVNEYHSYTKVDYCYIQNLSKDLNKAIEKAKEMGCENLEIDTDLYGRNNSFSTQQEKIKPKKCTEEVILWRIICSNSSEYTKEVKEEAKEQLINLGYAVIINNALVKVEHSQSFSQWYDDMASNSLVTTFVVEKNPDYDGFMFVGGNQYCFDVKSGYYNGFNFYLPIDKSGKAKKVKGKSIQITDFEVLSQEKSERPFGSWICNMLNDLVCYNDEKAPKFIKGNYIVKVNDFKVI